MNIGILGTGIVGRTLASKFSELNHTVVIGTRDVSTTLARTQSDIWSNTPFPTWKHEHPNIQLATFAETAAHSELIINATAGHISLQALQTIPPHNLHNKILLDTANPLDFSNGFPPTLSISNTDSLGEQIQRALPTTHVIKALNTIVVELMTNPTQLANGTHHLLLCGNDPHAKALVTQILTQDLGWQHIIDLGDITAARTTEMLLPLLFRLWHTQQTRLLNLQVII